MLFVRLPLNAPSRQQYKVNSGKSSERAANSASQIPKMSSKHTTHVILPVAVADRTMVFKSIQKAELSNSITGIRTFYK